MMNLLCSSSSNSLQPFHHLLEGKELAHVRQIIDVLVTTHAKRLPKFDHLGPNVPKNMSADRPLKRKWEAAAEGINTGAKSVIPTSDRRDGWSACLEVWQQFDQSPQNAGGPLSGTYYMDRYQHGDRFDAIGIVAKDLASYISEAPPLFAWASIPKSDPLLQMMLLAFFAPDEHLARRITARSGDQAITKSASCRQVIGTNTSGLVSRTARDNALAEAFT
ncbi:hypothetical protein DFJ77DRAFT_137010 [Powellomyces hirtus]|nr:hypothetical protein DFJ77DRAFT_137010 [Powellomyces hirtus]